MLDPNSPDALQFHGDLLVEVGRVKEALPIRQKLQALEPYVPVFNRNTAVVLWLNGQTDAALGMLKALPEGNSLQSPALAGILSGIGRYGEAANALLALAPGNEHHQEMIGEAVRLLRTAPAKIASPQTLPRLGSLGFAYLYVGAPNRVLEFYEDNVEVGYFPGVFVALLWHPSYAPVRKMERFKAYARKAGLGDYWRARGWPDLCHPVGPDDFACA